jgi:DNA polymerase-3 subunit beta
MKFIAERDTLLKSIAAAGRAAGGGIMGETPSLHLSLVGDCLTTRGADPDLTIKSTCAVDGNKDGTVVVPARLTVEIVKSFAPGAVVVAANDDVTITSGRAEFHVRTLDSAQLPQHEAPEGMVAIDAAPFVEGLRQVVRAALKDDSQAPTLTGVLAAPTDTGLRLVATDSYRLAVKDIPGITALNKASGVILPARALSEVQHLVGNDLDALAFGSTKLDAVFQVNGTTLTTRLINGEYPNYERLIPASYPITFTTDRDLLVSALKRVRTVITATKDVTTPVRLTLSDGVLKLEVKTPETADATDILDGTLDGVEIAVAFNPTYLIDGLDAVTTDDVVLQVTDAVKPATIKGVADDSYLYLLMPVRVSS